ncbi:MAG TPA: glycosyltransferase [Urbifossiella sp.]|jgi:glycosyltransferase involved in cell wall biosynthesis|nr:glycosyltransferase [Urbifossiella sp.]
MSALLAPRLADSIAPSAPATDPVRVSFVIDRLTRAGTETQLVALINHLDRSRVAPSLVLLDGEDDLSRALEPEDCPVVRLGVRKLLSRSAARAARGLRAYWRQTRPDVVQTYFQDSSYFGVPVARAAGVKSVVRVRNNLGYALTRRDRVAGRVIRPFVDRFLTNTASGKEAIVAGDGYAPDRVVVLENGVDTHRFNRFLLPDTTKKRVRVGCVANLRRVKNVDGLMRAAKRLLDQHPCLVFEVAGEGEQRAELERLHAELGLGSRFVFRGSVPDAAAFLRTIEVAVLSSHSEGMSNALLEYMAAGRAVVATAVGANSTLIDDEKNGLLVPPADDAALAGAVARYLARPLMAAAFGAAARRKVEAEFSRAAMTRRFEDFFHDLVGG